MKMSKRVGSALSFRPILLSGLFIAQTIFGANVTSSVTVAIGAYVSGATLNGGARSLLRRTLRRQSAYLLLFPIIRLF